VSPEVVVCRAEELSMRAWKRDRDPLFRGDASDAVQVPSPKADPRLVRHILYLEGFGRETPYLSLSEDRESAEHFAPRARGTIWQTQAPEAARSGVRHISRKELLQTLKQGRGGVAAWPSEAELQRARVLVERWGEHLYDYSGLDLDGDQLSQLNGELFQRARP
jgi:hypothetical protein